MFKKADSTDLPERTKILKMLAKRVFFILSALALCIFLVGVSINIGTADVSLTEVYKALINTILPGTFPEISSTTMIIVGDIRAVRALIAVFGGASLAIGGCITQSILKNPLATPYTLGVSAGAGFGAALTILLGISILGGVYGILLNALVFSLIPIGIVTIASIYRAMTPMMIILCGVAISYIFSASNTIFQFISDAEAVKQVVFWMVGDLDRVTMSQIPFVAVTAMTVFIIAMFLSKDMNIMRMGDDTAKSLGVNAGRIRTISLVLSCMLTAVVVSFCGAIGFICLLAPQISRLFVGNEMQYLLPASALVGACILCAADMLPRAMGIPLPVGAITALIGGPVLIMLLLRSNSYMGVKN